MTIARRDFLKTAGTLSLVGLGGAALDAGAADSSASDSLFDFADDRVPMNAANLCPMPRVVSESLNNFQADLDRDMSGANRRRIGEFKEQARSRIAAMLGVSADEIAIVRNTSV